MSRLEWTRDFLQSNVYEMIMAVVLCTAVALEPFSGAHVSMPWEHLHPGADQLDVLFHPLGALGF